jgi:acyl-CoA-binding protein
MNQDHVEVIRLLKTQMAQMERRHQKEVNVMVHRHAEEDSALRAVFAEASVGCDHRHPDGSSAITRGYDYDQWCELCTYIA